MRARDSSGLQPSRRVLLNIGGSRYETTAGTLSGKGEGSFFSSLLKHHPQNEELFVDRDGHLFAPLLSFLRTGELHVPPPLSEEALRREADFYCIPLPPRAPPPPSPLRCDGLYLSFYASEGDVRAYLLFSEREGSAVLGRREADGQWSALRCRRSTSPILPPLPLLLCTPKVQLPQKTAPTHPHDYLSKHERNYRREQSH